MPRKPAARPTGDGTLGRGLNTRDVLSAWMIYLVFLCVLLALSTLYLQEGQSDAITPELEPPDLALKLHPGPLRSYLRTPTWTPG